MGISFVKKKNEECAFFFVFFVKILLSAKRQNITPIDLSKITSYNYGVRHNIVAWCYVV